MDLNLPTADLRPRAQKGVKGFQRQPDQPFNTVERVVQIAKRLQSIDRCLRRRPSLRQQEILRAERTELRQELLQTDADHVSAGWTLWRAYQNALRKRNRDKLREEPTLPGTT